MLQQLHLKKLQFWKQDTSILYYDDKIAVVPYGMTMLGRPGCRKTGVQNRFIRASLL